MVAKQVNDSTVTIADYSLYVTRIPHNTKSSELREFFGRYGEVLTVELVKTDCELIACAKVRSEMADQLEVCKAVVQKAATKVVHTEFECNLTAGSEAHNILRFSEDSCSCRNLKGTCFKHR